jgi:hypothetical protein
MQQGMVSNGVYVIKRLKALYPSFRSHVDKLEKDEKRWLLEEYEKAFNKYTLREVTEKVSNAIQISSTRAPTISDIVNAAGVKQASIVETPDIGLEGQYSEALNRGDWREMQNLRVRLARSRLEKINYDAILKPTYAY